MCTVIKQEKIHYNTQGRERASDKGGILAVMTDTITVKTWIGGQNKYYTEYYGQTPTRYI